MAAPTELCTSREDRIGTWVVLCAGGALLGLAVAALSGWLLGLGWLPWRRPVELVDQLVTWLGGGAYAALPGAGALAGALASLAWEGDQPAITVADDGVTVVKGSSVRHHRAADVREVLLEGGELVLVASNGTDLARVGTELKGVALVEAFTAHGYRWQDPTTRC